MNRRTFLAMTGASVVASRFTSASQTNAKPDLLAVSQGKTCAISIDPPGIAPLDLERPNQATWQPGPVFPDGDRIVLMSMEPRRDGPGKSFEEYYHQTPTHLWSLNFQDNSLKEICTKDRLTPFYAPCLLVGDDRILVQVVRKGGGQVYSMRLDGSGAQPFTSEGEGLPYGLSLSPDRKRVAYHLASSSGYQIWTSDTEGGNRKLVVGNPEHLYFGTEWSPDGQWVLYQDCHYTSDPAHDWSDVCIGRPDASEHRVLTEGQAMWFGASYGPADCKGGGSNCPSWTRDGRIIFPKRQPDSKVPWEFQADRPDTDHFNRDYKPELARGATEICILDPKDNSILALTHNEPGVWDFRATPSPDGRSIAFCRAKTGESPSLWIMDSDGSNGRRLTAGLEDAGIDHPRWVAKKLSTR